MLTLLFDSNALSVSIYQQTRQHYPNISLLLTEGMSYQLEADLDATTLDLIIDIGRDDWRKYSEEKLIREQLFLVGKLPIDLGENQELTFKEAKVYLFAKTPHDHRMPQAVQDHFKQGVPAEEKQNYYID